MPSKNLEFSTNWMLVSSSNKHTYYVYVHRQYIEYINYFNRTH